ncbi:MAG TPA: thiamine-phosphate kinase [Candidatus Nitrosocosmicus sp.]|nr:thiamine-phosphate kinase [Candidatus Nitrosocosmicus sp.]
MKKFNEKQILNLIISRFGFQNIEPCFGRDDISIISLNSVGSSELYANTNVSLAVTCDMLVEHTDVPAKMTFEQIARKSMVSSISDLVSKGIKPQFALISLGLPKTLKNSEISKLLDGFKLSSKDFKIDIIGGDINESREIIIDCCMFGTLSSKMNIPRRNGAQEGDLVVVSGIFGYTSSGLKILMNDLQSPDNQFKKKSIDSVLNPTPSYKFGILLAHYFSSSIDSSDGLAASLIQISKESNVDLLIDERNIPAPPQLRGFSSMNSLDYFDLIFYGGEEYHIVGTISEKNLLKISQILKNHQLDLFIIGKVVRGDGHVFIINHDGNKRLLKGQGFIHFT